MRQKFINLSVFLLVFVYGPLAFGAEVKSQFNNSILNLGRKADSFSFLAVGHIYGSCNDSVYPAASLLANLEVLNNSEAEFMVLLGDVVRRAN
ncbi:MAG: hypothetical protein ABIH71_00400, partial [Candidatus Omnitrophota bacterium]